MKKLASITLILLLSTISSKAQNFDWAVSMGGGDYDSGYSIEVDVFGNVITCGNFQGTADFDPGPSITNLTSNGVQDIFIQKLDANGNFIWAISMGGSGIDNGSITTDSLGNIYVVGSFHDLVDFDPGLGSHFLTSNGGYDMFIQKLDPSGNLIWIKQLGNSLSDQATSIVLDHLGSMYIGGNFSSLVDFDPGAGTVNLTSTGDIDAFLLKLDTSGSYVWAKSMGGPEYDAVSAITLDNYGNIYAIGGFANTSDFDPGVSVSNLTSQGITDIFVTRFDTAGNYFWANSYGGTNFDDGTNIAVTSSGDLYFCGNIRETVDLDAGPNVLWHSSNGVDFFIEKLDSLGNMLWAKTTGAGLHDQCYGLAVDAYDNVYATGSFENTVDFDPGPNVSNLTSVFQPNIFIQRLTPSGDFLEALSIGNTSIERAYGIALDDSGNIHITGNYSGTLDFDPGPGVSNQTSTGFSDIFVEKLSPACSPNTGIDSNLICDSSFTWIDGITYTSNNYSATDTLTNSGGCDSIVTLHLAIETIDLSVVQSAGDTLTSLQDSATYQWLNCENLTAIAGANSQEYVPDSNGAYAVIVTFGSCSDTTDCFTIDNLWLKEGDLAEGFILFPNPTKDNVVIKFETSGMHHLSIWSTEGKLIYLEQFTGNEHILNCGSLPSGIYFIRIESEGSSKTEKLFKY